MKRTVVALFADLSEAERAIKEIDPGLAYSQISVVVKNLPPRTYNDTEFAEELNFHHREKLQNLDGVLVQSPVIDVPDLGKVAAAGPLAGALMQDDKGLSDSLIYYGIGTHEAVSLENQVREGATLVVIETDNSKVNQISNILHDYGAYDVKKWSTSIDHPLYPNR
ncbi:MAG: hypothetical protein ACYDG6_13800 [Thermincolia bacterium]